MSCDNENFQYYYFDEDAFTQIAEIVAQKHYPHRIPPSKWPDMKLIGKAMVRGWAVPCRYYPRPWRRGGYCRSFVFPGITDTEMKFIHALMRQEKQMYFIHGGRASGKTTYLLKMSADTGIPILTTNYWRILWYEEYAIQLGLKIPKPILWKNRKLGLEPDSEVLIDNGEEILNHILRFNSGVTCKAMVIDSPVMHITNCFLDNPEAFPCEVMGGKFESMDIERAYLYGEWAYRLKEE